MLCEKAEQLLDSFKNYKQDGWTISEIVRFCMLAIESLIMVAQDFMDLDGESKADWVADQIKDIYFTINPDIPLIPEFLEKKIEAAILDAILPGVIKWSYMKIFDKHDDLG